MIAGIVQPYFFPYLGYYQLINACDMLVSLDDVQYMKNGWTNRNRIYSSSGSSWMTFPVTRDHLCLTINQRHYQRQNSSAEKNLLAKLENSYRKAPHYARTMDLVERILSFHSGNVAEFNTNLLRETCNELGIRTPITPASRIRESRLKGADGVIDLCKRIGASHYINPIGGMALYSPTAFAEQGITLAFLQSEPESYKQFGEIFQPSLSIIDVMMFNDFPTITRMLGQYRLVPGNS